MSNELYPVLAGLTWNTTKTPLFNTIVQRSVNFSELRGSFTNAPIYDIVLAYDLLRDNLTNDELKTLLGFYLARHGSFDSFLYEDPDDSVALLETFGTGDGGTLEFQLSRAYGVFTEDCCNIAASPSIYVDGVLQTVMTDYSVSATGLVAFVSAPALAAPLTWSGTYYLRSRFMTDNSPMSFNQFARKLWEAKTVEFIGSFGTRI